MDKSIVINKSDSNNDDATAKWVITNLEYLLFIILIGNKLSFGSAIAANQVRFTVTIKNITSVIGSAIVGTYMGFIGSNAVGIDRKNSISSNDNNGMGSTRKVDMVFIGISSGHNNNICSNAEIGRGSNLGDVIIYLDILLITTIGLASS